MHETQIGEILVESETDFVLQGGCSEKILTRLIIVEIGV